MPVCCQKLKRLNDAEVMTTAVTEALFYGNTHCADTPPFASARLHPSHFERLARLLPSRACFRAPGTWYLDFWLRCLCDATRRVGPMMPSIRLRFWCAPTVASIVAVSFLSKSIAPCAVIRPAKRDIFEASRCICWSQAWENPSSSCSINVRFTTLKAYGCCHWT